MKKPRSRPRPPASPPCPTERHETVRAGMARLLREGPQSAKELSRALGLPEKDVAAHLEHLARSLEGRGDSLRVEPAECLGCGFRFQTRRRLTRPSRCPECGAERIEPPSFSLPPAP